MKLTEGQLRSFIREEATSALREGDASSVLYTGIVLDDAEGLRSLIDKRGFGRDIDGWETSNIGVHGHEQLNHHMTVSIGALKPDSPLRDALDVEFPLWIIGWGVDPDLGVAAWQVDPLGIPVKTGNPHITAALRDSSVKPFMASKIKNWTPLAKPFMIVGHLQEVRPRSLETRITESRIRRIIREVLLNEGPFDEFMTSSGPSIPPVWKQEPGYKKSKRSSIAHPSKRGKDKLYKGEKYTEIVKDLMSSTQDNWVIITPDDTWDYNHFKPGELEEWLRNKKKPAGTIFAYAAGIPMRGDERSPQWAVVHDLIGHTLERVWQYGGGRRPEKIPELEIAAELHNALPSKYRISNNPTDVLPDVLAAILLGALTPDLAQEVVSNQFLNSYTDEEIADAQERVDSMFRDVNTWIEEARANGFTVLAPW